MKGFVTGLYGELKGQRERLFLWVPVAFGIGIAVYFVLPVEPPLYLPAALALIFVPAAVRAHARYHEGGWRLALYLVAFAFSLMAAGMMAAMFSTYRHGTPFPDKSVRITGMVGTIESVDSLGEGEGSRIVLRDPVIEKLPPDQTPKKVRLRVRKDDGLKTGQVVSVLVGIDPLSGPVAPGAYDFQRHLFFEGIGAVGFSYNAPEILEEPERTRIGDFFEGLRGTIYREIEARAGLATAGIMTALITGQRAAIDDSDNDAMKVSGLYHLLSISGSHVSMVAATLFFFARLCMAAFPWAALHWPIKKIAAMIAMAGSVFYVVLAGADVPAVRAAMMTGLVLIAIMLDRSPFSLRLIAFAALMVLIFEPYSLVGVSFQMSFAAVAALICFFDYIHPVWIKFYSRAGFIRKACLYFIALVLTSIIAGAVTGVFGLYHFQQFAVYGVLANMMAVPLTGVVIMPAAVAAMILLPFGLHGWALDVMEWGTVWMLAIAHWTASIDGAAMHVAQWPMVTFVCICIGVVMFLLWEGWKGKVVAALIVLAGLVVTPFAAQPDILVSRKADLIAVLGDNGDLYFSSTRKEKFVAANWLRMAGREGVRPKSFKVEGSPLLCDANGCRMERKGQKIALSFNNQAWREDCAWADVVIAQVPVRDKSCHAYDFFDFYRSGAYGFYIRADGIAKRSAEAERGKRPWTRQ